MSLSDYLNTIMQRTASNFDLLDGQSRARFTSAVKTDFASVMDQLNLVYNPLVSGLSSDVVDPLDLGISGLCVYTDPSSTSESSTVFYDVSGSRAKTVKESFDSVLTNIATLTSSISVIADSTDVTAEIDALESSVGENTLDIQQLAKDGMGDNYVLDQTGVAKQTYSLAQHIDAIGSFFSNFPTTGNTYSPSYPSLALSVLLSDVTIDTQLAQNTIVNLPTHLTAIRTFAGMDTATSTTNYSAHGAVTTISDGDSLEVAAQKLDAAIDGITVGNSPFDTSGNVISNSNGSYGTDDFVIGSPSLVDDGTSAHDSRMFFDKSASAFAAGKATGTQWDTVGQFSVRFGQNCTAAGDYSYASGLGSSVAAGGTGCSIINSNGSSITGTVTGATILGGGNCEVTTGANYAVTMGQNASAVFPGQVVIGGSTFPGGGTTPGAAQASDWIMIGSWASTATDVALTTDGNAVTTTNIAYLPANTTGFVKVEWVLRGKQASSPFTGGGVFYAIITRIAGAIVVSDIFDLEGSVWNGSSADTNQIFIGSAGAAAMSDEPVGEILASGTSGGFYVNINLDGELFGGAADAAGRVVARCSMTAVRYTIP